MRRVSHFLLLGVLGLVVFGGAAVALVLASERGRAWMCTRINAAVSSQIAGRLVIERIEAIHLPRVKAGRVRILAPNGRPAIDVASADIEFELASFLTGDFVWRRADIR